MREPLWTETHVRNCLGDNVDYDRAFNLAMRIIGHYEYYHALNMETVEAVKSERDRFCAERAGQSNGRIEPRAQHLDARDKFTVGPEQIAALWAEIQRLQASVAGLQAAVVALQDKVQGWEGGK